MTDIQRDEKGRVVAGSGGALGATSPRNLGKGQLAQMRTLIEPERDAIVRNMIELAKTGVSNTAVRAAEVLLDRLAARPRPQAELVRIEGLERAQTLKEKCDAVVLAVARGECSADAGRAVLQLLDSYARAKRVDELEARIRALEGHVVEPDAPSEPVAEAELADDVEDLV